MRRRTLWALTLCGLGLVLCGFGLLAAGSAYAQDATDEGVDASVNLENARYVGVRECVLCHRPVLREHRQTRHALTLQDVRRNDDAVVAAFEQGEDARTVLLPGESEPRPFNLSDIAYAVGSGKNVQRYLYQAGPDEYMVLPAQWNVHTGAWEPYGAADEWPNESFAFGPNCAGCHTTDLDTEDFFWEEDGVQCESCHGPGSLHVEAASDDADLATIRASIVMSPDPQICGQCHSRGNDPETNRPFPANYRPGQADLLSDEVFALVPPDDEAHWWPTGHAAQKYMQFNEALLSGHVSALADVLESEVADDSCLQCHSGDYRWTQDVIALHEAGDRAGDSPEPVTLETAQFGVTCVNCHEPHGDTDLASQVRTDTYTLCGECHVNPPNADFIHYPAREMFEGIELVGDIAAAPSAHFTAEDGPRCATCHMPDTPVEQAGLRDSHRWTPILPGTAEALQDSCTGCHADFVDIEGMRQIVEGIRTSTQARLEAARAALTDTHPEWVGQALAFVENDGSEGIHNYAYTNALLGAAEVALGIAPEAVDEPDLSAFAGAPEPQDVQAASEPFAPGEFGGGLTLPSILLLGIGGLVLAIAAYAFFVRRP